MDSCFHPSRILPDADDYPDFKCNIHATAKHAHSSSMYLPDLLRDAKNWKYVPENKPKVRGINLSPLISWKHFDHSP